MSVNKEYLAGEYAEKEFHRVNGDDAPCFTDEACFNFDDIRYAFKAGYDSVFEGLRLLFKETQSGLAAVAKPLDEVYHVYKSASVEEPRYTFAFRYEAPIKWYDTLEEAMDAANDDYRERIKRALGL